MASFKELFIYYLLIYARSQSQRRQYFVAAADIQYMHTYKEVTHIGAAIMVTAFSMSLFFCVMICQFHKCFICAHHLASQHYIYSAAVRPALLMLYMVLHSLGKALSLVCLSVYPHNTDTITVLYLNVYCSLLGNKAPLHSYPFSDCQHLRHKVANKVISVLHTWMNTLVVCDMYKGDCLTGFLRSSNGKMCCSPRYVSSVSGSRSKGRLGSLSSTNTL